MLQDQAKAKAQDGGPWSKSMSNTRIKQGELDSHTKTTAHEPGGAPVKTTTTQSVPVTKSFGFGPGGLRRCGKPL
jgi:hypothetical protein